MNPDPSLPVPAPSGIPQEIREQREPSPDRHFWLPIVLGLAAAWATGMGVVSIRQYRSYSGGLLALSLPWMGAGFYAGAAMLSWFRPRSVWLTHLLGFYTFVHASLVTESLAEGRLCPPCLALAGVAGLAALLQVLVSPKDWVTPALGILLGISSGFFGPFDRVDDLVTRRLWPAHLLDLVPGCVDRTYLGACGHHAPVRLILIEKDCKT